MISHSGTEQVGSAGETSRKSEAQAEVLERVRLKFEESRRVSRSSMRRIDPHLCAWVDSLSAAVARMSSPIRCQHKPFDRGSGARGSRGWVYVIHSPATGLAKLGYTSNSSLDKRVRTIQGYAPAELEIVALANGGTQLEALWHQQYKAARRHLEWFDASAIVPVFRDAMSTAPADGCARCVLMGDRVPIRR